MTIVWFAVAAVFAIIEALTTGVTSIWFAGGALIAGVICMLNGNLWLQVGAFLVVSVLLLVVTRPLVRKHFNNQTEKTNVNAVLGKTAVVTRKIDALESGEVKLDTMVWKAVSDTPFAVGDRVKVDDVRGVTLQVSAPETEDEHDEKLH